MGNFDQEIQDVPAVHANKVRMTFVGSTSSVGTVDSQDSTVENKPVKWWALALPIVVLIVITAAHFLNAPVTTRAEGEKSRVNDPVLPNASTSSGRLLDKSPNKGLVSGIAHSNSHTLALINNNMVHEGDIVDGVTVIKIYEDKVEFEKDGKRWAQKVSEQPDSRWR